jgi:hypothetical protein
MTAVFVSLPLTACLFVAMWLFAMEGLRIGDRPGDTTVSGVELDGAGGAIHFTVHNPGRQAVLIGASLRRRSLRLWQPDASYLSVPRRTARGELLAGKHALVCVVAPGNRLVVRLAPPPALPRRMELAVAIGEPDRLRVLHRALRLPHARRPGPPPATAERSARWPAEKVNADPG